MLHVAIKFRECKCIIIENVAIEHRLRGMIQQVVSIFSLDSLKQFCHISTDPATGLTIAFGSIAESNKSCYVSEELQEELATHLTYA